MLPSATSRVAVSQESPALSPSVQQIVDKARRIVGRFDASWGSALARTDRAMLSALEAIYSLCVVLDRQPRQREAFLRASNVSPHGNVRNPQQPIVRLLLRECHGDLRSRVTKYAGVVALAAIERVPPKEFIRFVKRSHGGVAGAYREFVRRQKVPREQLRRLKERKEVVDRFIETGTNVGYPCTSQMEGRSGLALAVVDIAEGQFRVLRLLDYEPEEIERLVEPQARRWIASQGVR